MNKYLIIYQWYEDTAHGIITAENEDAALLRFAKLTNKLDCNYELEKKYGYGGSISPFFYDEDEDKTFEEVFKKFLNEEGRGTFQVIKLNQDIEGIITTKGFYNGQED